MADPDADHRIDVDIHRMSTGDLALCAGALRRLGLAAVRRKEHAYANRLLRRLEAVDRELLERQGQLFDA